MNQTNQLNKVLEHLNLEEVFIATQVTNDIKKLCSEHPEKIAGIGIIGPYALDTSIFEKLDKSTMIINSDHGPSRLICEKLKTVIKNLNVFEIENYEILAWSDIADDHPTILIQSITKFFKTIPISQRSYSSKTLEGTVENISYTIKGNGPPLVILPFSLAANQWDPVIDNLAVEFTVIKLTGPSLGGVPILETRAALPSYKTMLSSVLSIMQIRTDGHVLELGCGTAALCRQVLNLRPDLSVVGADINKYFLREGSQLAENEGFKVLSSFEKSTILKNNSLKAGHVSLVLGDANNIPFPDNSLDAVFSVTVLEECNAIKALQEIYRVLKPGGVTGIVVRAIDMPQWWNLDLSKNLMKKITIPPQTVGANGVADKTLYTKMSDANFNSLVCFPYMFTAYQDDITGLVYEQYRQRAKQNLNQDEQAEFEAAIASQKIEKQLMFSGPMHCCVGWK